LSQGSGDGTVPFEKGHIGLFTGVRGIGILRTSQNPEKAKFALIEYSEIRVRQESYSLLYEP
jgi:hypothetical protein